MNPNNNDRKERDTESDNNETRRSVNGFQGNALFSDNNDRRERDTESDTDDVKPSVSGHLRSPANSDSKEQDTERDTAEVKPSVSGCQGNSPSPVNNDSNERDNDAMQPSVSGGQRNSRPPNNDIVEPPENRNVRYGRCKWFNVAKGFGFITPSDGGQEVFVHQRVIQMRGFRSLGEQEEVEFECRSTERGLEATRVSGRGGTSCHGSTFRPRPRHRRVRCYNCGAFDNHIASQCRLGPQPKRCHLCKQDDHLFANCPKKNNKKR